MPTEIKALVSPTWLWGVTRLGGAWVGLVLPGNRDGAISTARLYATSLGSTKSKQAISSQCAGDRRLVHVRRQAVAAAELTGDVAVIILRSQTTKTAKYKKKALLISLFCSYLPWRCACSVVGKLYSVCHEGFEIFPGKIKIGQIIVMKNKCVKIVITVRIRNQVKYLFLQRSSSKYYFKGFIFIYN